MSEQFSSEITSDDKLWAGLSYVFSPLIPVIIMLMDDKKDRPFLKQHYYQALVAGIAYIILTTVTVGCLSILWFVMLYWGYKAYTGEEVVIPLISDFVKNQGWV
jgi:uncharacterized membrane protein